MCTFIYMYMNSYMNVHMNLHLHIYECAGDMKVHIRMYECAGDTYMCTGWRRLIGSPKLQIIFHKRATTYRSLFRKMTYKDRASYGSSPPCTLQGDAYGAIHMYILTKEPYILTKEPYIQSKEPYFPLYGAIHMYVCIFIYSAAIFIHSAAIYMYTHVCTHVYTHVYIYTYTHICMHMYI